MRARWAAPGSPAHYWELVEADFANMQVTVTPLDPHRPVFREPHAVVVGVVAEVIHEADGDTHLWLTLDGTTKARCAAEITPQQPHPAPPVGARVRVAGLLRYDLAHAWWEIHPIDYIEEMKA